MGCVCNEPCDCDCEFYGGPGLPERTRPDEIAFNALQASIEARKAEIRRLEVEIGKLKAAQNLVLDDPLVQR